MNSSPHKQPGSADDHVPAWSAPLAKTHEIVENLYHFSGRTVSARGGASPGIRLSKQSALNLPYVSARTLIDKESLLLDAVDDITPSLKSIRLMNYATERKHRPNDTLVVPAELKHAPAEVVEQFASAYERTHRLGAKETNTEALSPYLRQIFLPRPLVDDDNGFDYLCVTPLSAVGVAHILQKEVNTQREAHFQAHEKSSSVSTQNNGDSSDTVMSLDKPRLPRIRLLTQGLFRLGGDNPQNGGAFLHKLTRPYVFMGPERDVVLAKSLSALEKTPEGLIHVQGLQAYLPVVLEVKARAATLLDRGLNQRKFFKFWLNQTRAYVASVHAQYASWLEAVQYRGGLLRHIELIDQARQAFEENKRDPVWVDSFVSQIFDTICKFETSACGSRVNLDAVLLPKEREVARQVIYREVVKC